MAENNPNNDDAAFNNDIDGDHPFDAMSNERAILETARDLRWLGDLDAEIERTVSELEGEVSVEEYRFSSSLKKVLETLDLVFEWLEQSAKKAKDEVDGQLQPHSNEYQKKERVLGMLYHITALGSHISFVGLLEISCKFLDLPEYPYNAKREHVKLCLKEVEEQKEKVSELVEKACHILQEIIRETEFNQTKAIEFDVIVHQADALIKSCKSSLSSAEETIDELMKIMSTMKVFSRILRFAGFGATCYGLYHMAPSSATVDKLADYVPPTALSLVRNVAFSPVKYVGFAGLCAFFGYAWLSFFPSRAYAFRDDLTDLKLKHKRLSKGLHVLERRLKITVEDMYGVRKTKMWPKNEHSV